MQAGRTNGYIGLAFSYSDLPIGICDKKLKQKLTTLNFWDAKNRNTVNYVSSQRRTYSLTSLGSIFIIVSVWRYWRAACLELLENERLE